LAVQTVSKGLQTPEKQSFPGFFQPFIILFQ